MERKLDFASEIVCLLKKILSFNGNFEPDPQKPTSDACRHHIPELAMGSLQSEMARKKPVYYKKDEVKLRKGAFHFQSMSTYIQSTQDLYDSS